MGWGGVGWGGMITFMFLCTHRHSNLIIFLPVEQRQIQLFHDQLPVGWGELIRFMFLCILMSCVMMFKKKLEEESCYRDTMTKSHNKNVHRRPTV